jgi:hypothetical protein
MSTMERDIYRAQRALSKSAIGAPGISPFASR